MNYVKSLRQLEMSYRLNAALEEVIRELKEWECVQVTHHKDVGKTIAEWQSKGWRLHAYQATGTPTAVNHYLLFKKGE